jgi:hypothetical protein
LTELGGFRWNAFGGNPNFASSSAHGLLHLIHQPHRLAFIWNLAARISLPAIAANHLNVVVRRPFSVPGLHTDVEFEIRHVRAWNLL